MYVGRGKSRRFLGVDRLSARDRAQHIGPYSSLILFALAIEVLEKIEWKLLSPTHNHSPRCECCLLQCPYSHEPRATEEIVQSDHLGSPVSGIIHRWKIRIGDFLLRTFVCHMTHHLGKESHSYVAIFRIRTQPNQDTPCIRVDSMNFLKLLNAILLIILVDADFIDPQKSWLF